MLTVFFSKTLQDNRSQEIDTAQGEMFHADGLTRRKEQVLLAISVNPTSGRESLCPGLAGTQCMVM
jgi:hypothetical protein